MTATVSYNSHDYRPVELVPVIASFDTDGHITPLYVRLERESLKVDTFWVKCNFANIIEFHCNVIDRGTLRPLSLTYYQSEGVWGVPKGGAG